MKSKNILIVIFLTIMLVLAGCSGSGSNTKKNGYEIDSSFVGGSDAVIIKYSEQLPEEVFDGGRGAFPITLEVENKGEFEIPENKFNVVLKSLSPSDWNLESNHKTLSSVLRSVAKDGSVIGRGQVTFSNVRYLPELLGGSFSQPLTAQVCYPYQTTTITSVCLDDDIYSLNDDRTIVCEVNSKREASNSGAPIKVSNVEQNSGGESEIIISFEITHKEVSSRSVVYAPNSLNELCEVPNGEEFNLKDSVKFTVTTNLNGLDCGYGDGASGVVKLYDSQPTRVTCTQDISGFDDQIKPISIKLDYDYFDVIEETIVVKHPR